MPHRVERGEGGEEEERGGEREERGERRGGEDVGHGRMIERTPMSVVRECSVHPQYSTYTLTLVTRQTGLVRRQTS